jgi:heme/copper-type cytochrome/quinol oxidase subunit 3
MHAYSSLQEKSGSTLNLVGAITILLQFSSSTVGYTLVAMKAQKLL